LGKPILPNVYLSLTSASQLETVNNTTAARSVFGQEADDRQEKLAPRFWPSADLLTKLRQR
jgi:hypothetical protein